MIAPKDRKEAALRRLEEAQAELDRHGALADEASTRRARAMGAAYRHGATMTEIGDRLGIGHSAISHAMRRAGIDPAGIRSSRGDDSLAS